MYKHFKQCITIINISLDDKDEGKRLELIRFLNKLAQSKIGYILNFKLKYS